MKIENCTLEECPKVDAGTYTPIPRPTPSPGGDCDCDFSDYYTKEQVDTLINAIESGEFVVVETLPDSGEDKNIYLVPKSSGEGYDEYIYVDGSWEKIGDTSIDIDLSNYYTKQEVNDLIPDTSDLATKEELSEKQDKLTAGENITIENGVISSIDTDTKYTAGDNIQISDDNVISATDTTYTAGNNVTITDDNQINVDLSDYATQTDLDEGLSSKQDKLTAGDNITIEDGVISASQPDISNLATKTEVNAKQDKLTAGENITIENGVISSIDTDTKYTAGDNITISDDNVISSDLSNYYNKTEVNEIVDGIATGRFEAVEELPSEGEDKVIYLVPNNREHPNIYDEYIYVDGEWEKIGDTDIDLSSYVTNTQLNEALENKQDKLIAGDHITISSDGTISAVCCTREELLKILGYNDITFSTTDGGGNEVTAHVLGYIAANENVIFDSDIGMQYYDTKEIEIDTELLTPFNVRDYDSYNNIILTLYDLVVDDKSYGDVYRVFDFGRDDENGRVFASFYLTKMIKADIFIDYDYTRDNGISITLTLSDGYDSMSYSGIKLEWS